MQKKRDNSMMHDDKAQGAYKGQVYYRCTQGVTNNKKMSSVSHIQDLPKPRILTSQLPTVNVDMSEFAKNLSFDMMWDDQNVDMDNCSTLPCSRQSSQTTDFDGDSPSWAVTEKRSRTHVAPVKQEKRNRFKNLLKDFNRDEMCGQTFLNKLNKVGKQKSAYSALHQRDDEMSLEQHLEALSNRYMPNNNIAQNQKSTVENLDVKIVPKTFFATNIQISLESRKSYYRAVKKDSLSVRITLPASVNNWDIPKLYSLFEKQDGKSLTRYEIFHKINKELLEKGLNMTIKVNEEPIFPAKQTLEYLLNLSKPNAAK